MTGYTGPKRQFPRDQRGRADISLTQRRLQVLTLAAAGLTDKEIAHELSICVRTVRLHFAASCRALGARTRSQATALAAAAGLVDPFGPRRLKDKNVGQVKRLGPCDK